MASCHHQPSHVLKEAAMGAGFMLNVYNNTSQKLNVWTTTTPNSNLSAYNSIGTNDASATVLPGDLAYTTSAGPYYFELANDSSPGGFVLHILTSSGSMGFVNIILDSATLTGFKFPGVPYIAVLSPATPFEGNFLFAAMAISESGNYINGTINILEAIGTTIQKYSTG
jgi:hypothetical protein